MKIMNMPRFFYKRQNKQILLIVLPVFLVCACSSGLTIKEPESVHGVYIDTAYEFYRWEEGLALMIWHDGIKSSDCATSTNGHGYINHCQVISEDDVRIDWQLETKDGATADFKINDQSYHLEDGALFIITASGGDAQVRQLERDLSTLPPNADGIVEFGMTEPAIVELTQAPPGLDDCVSSSAPPSPNEVDLHEARAALYAFFAHLQAGEYEQATEYYGGSYEVMRDHNPSIDPDDHAALFHNACTVNGAQCLKVLGVTLLGQPSPMEYQFAVKFANDDGSIFGRGPCCGEEDDGQFPQEEFIYTVRLECTGRYRVAEMPVYLP
jgi:hypothetical protein